MLVTDSLTRGTGPTRPHPCAKATRRLAKADGRQARRHARSKAQSPRHGAQDAPPTAP
ncbi:hypothetical protein BCR44DRAFT_1213814 [Catenaria anguillulae PL171]|uniref:Uncharacterized protein n=1 Tax=Catenaria anguillulae PL171 TaxID=765915 RepID=A0A1Y2HYW3_9FUNG|nr:hypothetical protein BCR44DRAFT_1213814 [Catenaria anguillulae PL171]